MGCRATKIVYLIFCKYRIDREIVGAHNESAIYRQRVTSQRPFNFDYVRYLAFLVPMLFLVRGIARSLPLASRRTFHFTSHRRAVEDRDAFFRAFQNTTIFQKLAGHPEAVTALEDFAKLLQDKGRAT